MRKGQKKWSYGIKTFKRYGSARREANKTNGIVMQVGDIYITGTGFNTFTSINVYNQKGYLSGYINLGHLDKIGNGNYATPDPNWIKAKDIDYALEDNNKMAAFMAAANESKE